MLHDITVFDFETTGLDPRAGQVVEVAAVRVRDGEEVASFSCLVRLDGRAAFSPEAQRITGLTPERLASGMKERAAMQHLHELMRGSVLVAHNVLFDYSFLHYSFLRAGLPEPTHDFLCTLTIGRNRQPGPHKLAALTQAYGLPVLPAHQALSDVRMTLALLRAYEAEGPTKHYLNRAGWDGRFEHPRWYPSHARLVKQNAQRLKPGLNMPVNAFR